MPLKFDVELGGAAARLSRSLTSTPLRFGLVGILNTALGFGLICVGLLAGMGDFAANAMGYGAGLLLSFFLNRYWTFAGRGGSLQRDATAFLAAWIVAYAMNLAVIGLAHLAGWINAPLVHLAGVPVFSGAFYLLSNSVVFRPPQPSVTTQSDPSSWLPELGLFLLAAGTFLAIRDIQFTHDVVWQFWIARQMLGGAVLYRDIWELNPPLWFWSAVPIQFTAEKLSLTTGQLLVPLVTLGGFVSALLVGRLGQFSMPVQRFAVMALAFWVSVPMPLFDFGQREQLTLICAFPYAMLLMRRREGIATSTGMALFVGLFAAYGFALKHYFLLVPVALELWCAAKLRRTWHPIRPETLALATAGVVYATAVVVFAPEFLTRMVPMVSAAYFGYETPVAEWFDEPAQIVWFFSILFLALDWGVRRRPIAPQTAAFALCALGFGAAYFLQRKGWQYHAIPVTGTILMAVACQAMSDGLARLWRYPLAMLTIAFAVFVGIKQGPYVDFLRRGSEAKLQTVPAGEPVAMLVADPMFTWPLIEQYRLKWPMHVYSYWMIPAIGDVGVRRSDPAKIKVLSAQILDQTVKDFRCHPPALVMIEKTVHSHGEKPRVFNVVTFFFGYQPFARFMSAHYREEEPMRLFNVYRRVANPPPLDSAECRPIR